ncbi:hypothetical protein Q9293_06795 [Geothrix sp. PMB-07]|nr:hypothetical protein [Geothrix sp. PMB-07]WLT33029.1 hypothetical protein Q9293_06795 [Geothrix sp. PMB-07]
MVFFNHATRQMTAKIVYYGPGLCGKTTNLNTIYGKTSQKARGEMVSLNTETDRTLFFDLLPMDVGMVGGFKTKLQLYTVPGQVFYNSTRKLVLKGVDGIVFVVDSQTPMLDACRESYQNLEENLRELGLNLHDIPTVFQWNKRDLRNVVPVEELEAVFNPKGAPSFQSVAADGSGVFETLRGITKLALFHIKTHVLGEGQGAPSSVPPVSVPAPSSPVASAPSVVTPVAEPPRNSVEALTLSDLPSVTDILDMEESASFGAAPGSVPLPDEDEDTGFYIEAPVLPEHPGAANDDVSFLMLDAPPLPPMAAPPSPAAEPEEIDFPQTTADLPVAMVESPAPPPSIPDSRVHESLPVARPTPAPFVPQPVHAPAKPAVKVDPLAALASLKVDAKRPPIKAKPSDNKDAINSLMGELTQVGRTGAPSVLRLEVPSVVDGQELEVVVQLRCRGEVVAEGQIHRPAPVKGITAKLSVEMKRS